MFQCSNYSAGLAIGTMCSPLCEQRTLEFSKCLGHGIKIVIEMKTAAREPLVLKSSSWSAVVDSPWGFATLEADDRRRFLMEVSWSFWTAVVFMATEGTVRCAFCTQTGIWTDRQIYMYTCACVYIHFAQLSPVYCASLMFFICLIFSSFEISLNG